MHTSNTRVVFNSFALAHLIRDVKFLTTLPKTAEQAIGKRWLRCFKLLFHYWHRRDEIPKEKFDPLMQRIRKIILQIAESAVIKPELAPKAARLAKRIRKHDAAIFRFLFDMNVSPTNNISEQGLRHAVIDRKLTQGSRAECGRQWNARIWTVLSTCRKQGRSSWQFILDAINGHYFGGSMPSLLS